MPVRELNTSTKIETAPPPPVPGHRLYHAPRVSGYAGIVLRVARGKKGTISRTIQVIARGPDRRERRAFVSNWPPAANEPLSAVLARGCAIRDRLKKGLDPYPATDDDEALEPKLAQVWARYVQVHSGDKKDSTCANDERLWRVHVEPFLGTKRPTDLTYETLKIWYAAIAITSVVNANRSFQLLRSMLNAAKRKWKEPWARENPCDVFGSGDRKNEKQRIVVLTHGERTKLLKCITEHPFSLDTPEPDNKLILAQRQTANCLLLVFYTGCRKSEALNARWSEFDLENGVWSIPASRTKQSRTVRVPLLPDALRHARVLHENRTSDELVFPQAKDSTKPQNTLKRSWKTIITRAGLTKVVNLDDGSVSALRIHDMRHLFGTMAVEAGVPLEVVSGLLGHSQISTTQRYAHVHDKILQAGVAKIAVHLDAINDAPTTV